MDGWCIYLADMREEVRIACVLCRNDGAGVEMKSIDYVGLLMGRFVTTMLVRIVC